MKIQIAIFLQNSYKNKTLERGKECGGWKKCGALKLIVGLWATNEKSPDNAGAFFWESAFMNRLNSQTSHIIQKEQGAQGGTPPPKGVPPRKRRKKIQKKEQCYIFSNLFLLIH